jgi:hypothetical protein
MMLTEQVDAQIRAKPVPNIRKENIEDVERALGSGMDRPSARQTAPGAEAEIPQP